MTDSWATPLWVQDFLGDYFDPCPLNDNWEVDGLKLEWKDRTYCNPPFSNPLPWVEKAIEENKKGKQIIMMLNVDMTTKWFRKLLDNGVKLIYFGDRLKFSEKLANNKPNMLAILPKVPKTKQSRNGGKNGKTKI